MDEGRLAVVFRREEQHRKFVYVMNDIVRSRFSLYTNCLEREQHESSLRLVKNCAEMRRSIVRQKVLRKCLEMRKRKIITRDPTRTYGQYGGKPLWAMSRDIDRVIADNHPRIRRMKRVEEVMRKSLETGAILDEDAVSRRMEAFFQLKGARKPKEESPERIRDVLKAAPLQRRIFSKPPIRTQHSPKDASQDHLHREADSSSRVREKRRSSTEDTPAHDKRRSSKEEKNVEVVRKGSLGKENLTAKRSPKEPSVKEDEDALDVVGVINKVSLDVDSKGRLQGIRTSVVGDTIDEEGKDEEQDDGERMETPPVTTARGEDRLLGKRERMRPDVLSIEEEGNSEAAVDNGKKLQYRGSDDKTLSKNEYDTKGEKNNAQNIAFGNSFSKNGDAGDENTGDDKTLVRSRSKLILPPIQPTKALVSKR